MRIEAGVATDKGQVREGNEDAYLVEPPLYAVADGMGGHRGGEVASQLALETIADLFRKGDIPLAEQVREANRAVFERSGSDRAVAGMGTTLTAALVQGELAHLIHVGDSRAYLLRAGALRQLTEDHTLVNRMVKAGEITEAEAEVHPHRNVITRSLGTESDIDIDEQDIGLLDGDRLLLCSDGLTGMLTEAQIQAILEATPSTQETAERLVRAANRAGGVDNITVVVLDVAEGEPEADHPGSNGSEAVRERDVGVAAAHGPASEPPTIGRRRRWLRVGLVVAIVIVVLGAALAAFRAYLDGQWYVGEANGNVAIYQGIPVSVLGYDLSHVSLMTEIPADAAAQLPFYADLPDGINANSYADATNLVTQIRRDVKQADRSGGGG
jgi:serine/threonine protein phosphatase PrpC